MYGKTLLPRASLCIRGSGFACKVTALPLRTEMEQKSHASDPVSFIEKKAVELGVNVATAAAEEAEGIFRRLLGPLASELGERFAIPMRERRLLKSYEMLARVEERIKEHQAATGAEQVPVPARGVLPLIEAASLEDDPDLSSKYEELLANAATGTGTNELASFTEILRQLSPLDAQLLQEMFNAHVVRVRASYEEGAPDRPAHVPQPHFDLAKMVSTNKGTVSQTAVDLPTVSYSATAEQLRVSTDNLFRLGLLRDVSKAPVLIGNRDASERRRGQRTGAGR